MNLVNEFHLEQIVFFSTHIHGGTLDLLFRPINDNRIQVHTGPIRVPFISDHHIVLADIEL